MLFPQLKSNPFIQTERVLPIEFPYPYKFTMLSTLTLPEGYEVEELPNHKPSGRKETACNANI